MNTNNKPIPMAICYDFDETLANGYIQEFGFIDSLGLPADEFWSRMNQLSKQHQMDEILAFMKLVLDLAKQRHIQFHRQDFQKYGQNVLFYTGVETWFSRISDYARRQGVQLDHYVISSGLKEMIAGTKIAPYFREIYGSFFMYDENDVAIWPAFVLNYTLKTQALFRINKGCPDMSDGISINRFMPKNNRPLPFEQMVYIGDGETDVPCMQIVKNLGGHSIVVHTDNELSKKQAQQLLTAGRVNLSVFADYSEGGQLDTFIKSLIDDIAFKNRKEAK